MKRSQADRELIRALREHNAQLEEDLDAAVTMMEDFEQE